MPIDRVDQNREDNQRIDRKEDEIRRQNKARRHGQDFQVQYAAASQSKKQELNKNKDKEPHTENNPHESENKNESLLFKIVQAVKSDQDSHSEGGMNQNQKELQKKDDNKKDDSVKDHKEESSTKDSSRSSEGHKRVGEAEGQSKDNNSGSGQGGGQGSGQGGSQQGFQSGSGSMGGGSGKQQGQSFDGQPQFSKSQTVLGEKMGALSQSDTSGGGQNQNLRDQKIDELVESIFLGVSKEGNAQLVIELNDPELAGIKLHIERKKEGLHIRMICEKKSVRNKLALERLKLYDRLKKKNLTISRIDIE